MLLHAIGHSFGALGWKKAPNEVIGRVIHAMQSNHFAFMGRSVSFGSFYEGYGITMIFVLLLISWLLWLLSYDTNSLLTARLLVAISIFLFLLVVSEYVYFFPFAALFTLLAGICALAARIRMPIVR